MSDEELSSLQPARSPSERDREADAAIRRHMGLAMGGGAIPVPLVDLAAVTVVQLQLLKRLAAVYETPFDARSSRAFLTSVTAALGASAAGRVGASLAKTVPGVGAIGGGIAQVLITGASTYAVGQVVKRVFRDRRALEELDVDDVRGEVESHFEAGRERAREVLDTVRSGERDE